MEDLNQFVPDVRFEKIPIRNLVSNQEYQRNLSQKHIRRTVANFDLLQINPVKVSRRDGINYVFNGQHTIEIVAAVAQIVVAPRRQGRDLLKVPGHGGQEQDRRIAELPDPPTGLIAVHPRHHHIQDNQLHAAIQLLQGLRPAGGRHRLIALALGQQLDDAGDIRVIVHDQDLLSHSTPTVMCYQGLVKNLKIHGKFLSVSYSLPSFYMAQV